MRQTLTSLVEDLLSAFFYVVALCAILAALIVAGGVALEAMPRTLVQAMPQAETTGSGAPEEADDSRFTPWRITPMEAQKRFETRSLALFPPTPIAPMPENWSPHYAAMAKKQALMGARAQAVGPRRVRARIAGTVISPLPPARAASPRPMVDAQMDGR